VLVDEIVGMGCEAKKVTSRLIHPITEIDLEFDMQERDRYGRRISLRVDRKSQKDDERRTGHVGLCPAVDLSSQCA